MTDDKHSASRETAAGLRAQETPTPVDGGKLALVLGGGGSAGNAWEIGVIAGLYEAGLDVTVADRIVGTSAGATVAAQLTEASPVELLAAILAVPAPRPGPARSAPERLNCGSVADHLERTSRIIAAATDPTDMRRRMGAAARELDAASNGAWRSHWRAIVAARLRTAQWPERDVLIPAVEASTGEPVVFDRHCGVDLVDAVAASTSASLPYRIADKLYIDGGYRRNENADLAVGCARVLVLSPFGGRTRHPLDWGMQLDTQVDELRTQGSIVATVFPDEPALAAFGSNVMDPSTRPPAARAGSDQGRALAEQLGRFWN
ncbi:MAG: patatin-like phospholipase family protein [Actinomycetota bacterium]|nr:patatin-like phospholipase family protein [Actinomycetota bacterium]